MRKKMKNFLRGYGSILQLNPPSSPVKFPQRRDAHERQAIANHWSRVGGYLSSGMNHLAPEVKAKSQQPSASKNP